MSRGVATPALVLRNTTFLDRIRARGVDLSVVSRTTADEAKK